MAEALSQSQIDDLLQKMFSGNAEEPKAEAVVEELKHYDFTSPKKFTKDQLKSLNTLYENVGRTLAVYFTGIARSLCEIEVLSVDEERYSEFNNALPESTLVAIISLDPLDTSYDGSTVLMEFPTSFGFLLLDRLMGGSGRVFAPDRDYTEIEISLLEYVLNNVAKYLQDAWSNYFPVNLRLQNIETNGRMLQAYSQQDVVAIVTLDVKNEFQSSLVNVCMAAGSLEKIVDSFSPKFSHAQKQLDPQKEEKRKNVMMGYLKESDLEVEAVLETCQMNLSDIVSLQPGDVIALNKRINTDISINVEGMPWATARLGEMGDNMAIRIVQVQKNIKGELEF